MDIPYCELTKKEVVNVCDGKVMGFISDMLICASEGRIMNFSVRQEGFFPLKKKNDIIITWDNIERIGEDTVLVRINPLVYSDGAGGKP